MNLRTLWSDLAIFFYVEIAVIVILVYFPILSTGLPTLLRGGG